MLKQSKEWIKDWQKKLGHPLFWKTPKLRYQDLEGDDCEQQLGMYSS